MAATNPFRVSDLISKYGWQIFPYLSNLGVTVLAEAQVLFVDSGHTNALDADDGEHGHSFERPLATWDYANGLCTASEQSIILLGPGHNEGLGAAQIDFDVIGVHTIGVGSGSLKPRIDFDNAASSIDIGANNVTIQNVDLLPSITSVLIGVHVETGVTDFRMKDVRFLIGEDGSGADEFVKAVELTSGNHDCVFEDVTILAHASAAQATHGIHVAAASNRLTFRNVIIDGPYATGGIVETAAGVNHIVENCAVDVTGTNYSLHGSSTFAKRTSNIDGQVTEDESESLLLTTRGTGVYPTGITDESILAYVLGKSATASADTFDNTTHSLEAIGDNVIAISSPTDVTGAVAATPTASSLQDILQKDANQTYSRATDSLEAIRDYVAGTTALDGINLDHLALTSTGVAIDGELDGHVTALSILGHIMASDADPSSFNCSTDSLQAIADAVAGITFTAAVSATPTARSMQDILEKDNSGSFDDSTDSLEAIRDHLDGTTILGGIGLDHISKTASAGTNYPTEITTDSFLGMLLSTNGNANGYNKTTDSLQAISDFVRTGTTLGAGVLLPNLMKTDTAVAADGDLTSFTADGTVLAHIMSATANTSTFKATTDSLEAIAVALAAGTGATAAIEADLLDELCSATTGIAADASLILHTVSGSLMSHIMSATAVGSTYQCSTDSLEAISVALGAGTGCSTALDADQLHTLAGTTTGVAADSDLETYCVAGSLMSHVLSKAADVTAFKPSTDSLEAISDKIGAYTMDGGADDEDTIMAHLDLILTDTAAIDPAAPRLITATLTDWSLAATNALFTVSGMVKARIWGEVLVGVKAVTMNLKISSTPTAPGGLVDIAANLDCDADAAGTIYKMNTTLGGAMVAVTGGVTADDGIEVILPAGVVQMGSAANEDGGGSIQWFCQYEPLEAGATVTAT